MFTRSHLGSGERLGRRGESPSILDVAAAIDIWVAMNWDAQTGAPTLYDCAKTFNTTVELVRAAVSGHGWHRLAPKNEPDPKRQSFSRVDAVPSSQRQLF